MWWYRSVIGAAIAAMMTAGCGSPGGNRDAGGEPGAAVAPQETVYRKIGRSMHGDTAVADTTALRLLSQDGIHVYGSYLWRPPEKDGRTGAISGIRDRDTVTGLFSYSQEGAHYTDSVKIVLSETSVVITQQPSQGYPIVDTLLRSE